MGRYLNCRSVPYDRLLLAEEVQFLDQVHTGCTVRPALLVLAAQRYPAGYQSQVFPVPDSAHCTVAQAYLLR